MVKDGEDWHGLKTTKIEKFSQTFQTVWPWLSPFNPSAKTQKWHYGPKKRATWHDTVGRDGLDLPILCPVFWSNISWIDITKYIADGVFGVFEK